MKFLKADQVREYVCFNSVDGIVGEVKVGQIYQVFKGKEGYSRQVGIGDREGCEVEIIQVIGRYYIQ